MKAIPFFEILAIKNFILNLTLLFFFFAGVGSGTGLSFSGVGVRDPYHTCLFVVPNFNLIGLIHGHS